jgi:peptidoglycan-N-acetylglucosamine deacetylase
VSLLHDPRVRGMLSSFLLCEAPGAGPRFALTFDDGPSPRNTPALLDVLARHGARATFFVMTARARRRPDLVRRAAEAGHEIGVHGGWHVPPWLLPGPFFDRELSLAGAAVADAAGRLPSHYRAPFGLLLPGQARWAGRHGLTAVLGSIYPSDARERSANVIAGRVLPRLVAGSIVILHDSSALADGDRGATVAAVDAILGEAARRGLASVTLEELCTAPARAGPREAGDAPDVR